MKLPSGSNVSPSVIKRYLKSGDSYLPGLEMLPRLCAVLGNTILLQWLEAQVESEEESVPPAQSRAEVLTSVARAGVALGDVQRILVESKVIAPHHAREIRSALNDVITECRIAKESLQPLAAHRDMTKYAPLFSLKEPPGRRGKPPSPELVEVLEKGLMQNTGRLRVAFFHTRCSLNFSKYRITSI